MSTRLQMEKKKAQEEMRRLMTERRKKDKKQIKIDNPLAKYNNTGQLTCILCSSIVKSELVWPVHVNSKQHRENVEKAKKLKQETNNFTAVNQKHKNSSPPKEAPPEKKLKGILKNAITAPQPGRASTITRAATSYAAAAAQTVPHHNEEINRQPLNLALITSETPDVIKSSKIEVEGEELKVQATNDQLIPEGFFDDPILDAKVRNIEYKDPVEEEWEKFQKEIKEEATASAEIIADEQIEATVERQIDEIDEQLRNWTRVLDLEVKKEETKKKTQEMEQTEDYNSNSDDEEDIDEFLDWRSKRS